VARGRTQASPDDFLHLLTDDFERHVQRPERFGGDAVTLVDQAQEDVLGADVVVAEHPRLLLGKDHHAKRSVGESLEQTIASAPDARAPGGSRLLRPSTRTRT
jgi:nanoRNase/pAp phosphatase (c-di-AMP/oligoRNAs hydrolase)